MLDSKIESILFVASKPLSAKDISRAVGADVSEVVESLETLEEKYRASGSGICLFTEGDCVRMGTVPENAQAIESFLKDEVSGELTRAQLETLTVISYRGPITQPELEQIRGVNCSIILRNLLIRGLIEQKQDDEKLGIVYMLSFEALAHLGITSPDQLPEYETLSVHAHLSVVTVD